MEVLNNIALPQSTEHFHLLLFIYNILLAVLLPYAALLTGSILFAVWADRKGDPPGQDGIRLLSRRLVSAVLPSRTFFTFFALLPALAIVFVYAQTLQGTPALAAGFAAATVLLLSAAGVAGFAYQYTFRLAEVFGPGTPVGATAAELQAGAVSTHRKSGTTAAWTIAIGSFCLSAALAIGIRPMAWTGIASVFGALVSPDVWLAWFLFLSLSAAMAAAGILFFHHRSGIPVVPGSAYDVTVRSLAIRLLTGAILALPAVLALTLLRLEDIAVSGWVYALGSLTVLALFGALHALYAYVRLERAASASYAFLCVVAATTFLASMYQVALHNATRDHAVRLAVVYDREEEALKTALGVGAKPLTGEDIYNGKCSACHMFDQKKVGPAYTTVVVKYAGKKTDLIRFVLNPQKIRSGLSSHALSGFEAGRSGFDRYVSDEKGWCQRILMPPTHGHGQGSSTGGLRARVAEYISLGKPGLTLMSVSTALAGGLLAPGGTDSMWPLLGIGLGTLCVGSGAVTLNQYREREFDALMQRTRRRPLPRGSITPSHALSFGILLAAAGIGILASTTLLATFLALLTLLTYVLVYTPMKRSTHFATAVGGLPGAIPPLIGWTAITGNIAPEAYILFLVLFLWQMPHFLSLGWMYQERLCAGRVSPPAVGGRGRRNHGQDHHGVHLGVAAGIRAPVHSRDGRHSLRHPRNDPLGQLLCSGTPV